MVLSLLLFALAGGFAVAAPAGRAESPGRERATTIVRPDDTLWSIAERCVPGRDRFDAIDEIRRLNGISGYTVHAGQRLVLPRRR